MKKTLEIEQGRTIYLVHRQYGEEMQSLQQQVADCARKILKDLEGNPLVEDLKYRLQAGRILPNIPLDDVHIRMNMSGVLYFEWEEAGIKEPAIPAPPPKAAPKKTAPTEPPKPETKLKTESLPILKMDGTDAPPFMTVEDAHKKAKGIGWKYPIYGGNSKLFDAYVEEFEAKEAAAEKEAAAAPPKEKPKAKKATPPPEPPPVQEPAPQAAPKKQPEDDGMDEDLSSLFDTIDIPDDDGTPDAFRDGGEDEDGFSSPDAPSMEQMMQEADEFDLDKLIGEDLDKE